MASTTLASKLERLRRQLEDSLHDRDTSTSADESMRLAKELEQIHITVARVSGQCEGAQRKLAEVQRQLDGAHGTIAELRAQLEFERRESQKLKNDLANMSMSSDDSLAASSSLPNLLTPGVHTHRNKSDSWTTPPPQRHATPSSRRPDVSALKAKNEDMTRLNAELQRKCQEQLLKTPPNSRPTSGGQAAGSSTHFQTRLREQREGLQREMMERERELLSQVREAEHLLLEKEEEWLAKEEGLRQEVGELKDQLEEASKEKRNIRVKVVEEMEQTVRSKDEQILK